MAAVYYLTTTDSDLSGGADFNKVLSLSTQAASTISVPVAAGATETSYGFTASLSDESPDTIEGESTGTFTIYVNVTTGNSGILGSISLSRLNSTGTVQATSTTTTEQTLTAGVKTFSLVDPALGTWNATDRLRVNYIFRSTLKKAATIAIGTGTIDESVETPFLVIPPPPPPEPTITGTILNKQTVDVGFSESFTVPADADALLVIIATSGVSDQNLGADHVQEVTFDDVEVPLIDSGFTQAGTEAPSGERGTFAVAVHYLRDPPTGAATLTTDPVDGTSAVRRTVFAIALKNAGNLGTFSSAQSSKGTSPSASGTAVADSLVFAALAWRNSAGDPTAQTTTSENADTLVEGESPSRGLIGYVVQDVTGTIDFDWTMSSSIGNSHGGVISVRPPSEPSDAGNFFLFF